MTGDTHYDFEVLAELAEGLLDVTTAARVREHLAVCDPCGESLAELAAVRELLAAVPVPAMPMGVALRIDKALSDEADSRRAGGLKLEEAPDWDRIMADAPWETASPMPLTASAPEVPSPSPLPVIRTPVTPMPLVASVPEPSVPESEQVVRLGVVADDGSIAPARRRKASRRGGKWAMPMAAGMAAAVVLGAAGISATMLSATGTDGRPSSTAIADGPRTEPRVTPSRQSDPVQASRYIVQQSGFNYSSNVLDGPLVTYVGATGPGAGGDPTVDPAVERCVSRIAERVGAKLGTQKTPNPIGVDQALYEGNEATVMAFWKDRMRNAVWVYVVDDNCKYIRKPAVGRWQ